MSGQPAAGGASVPTPRWQAAMAVVSLVLLTVVVLLPMALLAMSVCGLVLGVASVWSLDVVGVKSSSAVMEAAAIAAALFGLAAVMTMVQAILSGIMKLEAWRKSRMPGHVPPRVVVPPTNPSKSWRSFLFEHPWFSLAGLALLVDGCIAPMHASRAIHLPPELLGGFILTGATLLFLFVVGYALRGSYHWMRSLWLGVRQSPFFAGLMTAGCLVASATVLLIGHAFGQVASALNVPETTRALESCSGSTDCSRRVLQDALGGKPRTPASLPADEFTPEERSSFDACVEEIHRRSSEGSSPREYAHQQAVMITRNAAIADDVVHDAMVAVCLSSHRIRNVVPYFIRSVQNAAKREWRRGRRYCSLVIEEPNWSPNQCIQENVEVWNETIWMEASANDALCALPADERQIIEWYVWDGLSHAQIAAKMRIKESTARQKFSRARKVLQEKYSERCR